MNFEIDNIKIEFPRPGDLLTKIEFFNKEEIFLGQLHYYLTDKPNVIISSAPHVPDIYKGNRVGINMYLWLYSNPPEGVDTIITRKNNWFNREQIPRIYKRLQTLYPNVETGALEDDNAIISFKVA